MQIKKYQAPTLQKAIEQIRDDLGDGAIILQTEPLKTGPFGRDKIEVTAAVDQKAGMPRFKATLGEELEERDLVEIKKKPKSKWASLFSRPAKSKTRGKAKGTKIAAVKKVVEKAVQESKQTETKPVAIEEKSETKNAAAPYFAIQSAMEPLQRQIDNLKKGIKKDTSRSPSNSLLEKEVQDLRLTIQDFMLEKKFQNLELPKHIQRLFTFWRSKGMSETQIYGFLHKMESTRGAVRPFLEQYISEAHALSGKEPRIIVVVGPTGVGKTTSVAKLAAFERIKRKRSVALLTLDDYKVGGTDQLGHFARILKVPFTKVRSDYSLEEQLKSTTADTIFVDTFGVSPRDHKRLSLLKKALQAKDPLLLQRLETHLVLPVGLSTGDVDLHLDGFSRLHPDYLLFTKWDETLNWGGMLATILKSKLPVSFIGHGQEVPDDIASFSSHRFIDTVTAVEI